MRTWRPAATAPAIAVRESDADGATTAGSPAIATPSHTSPTSPASPRLASRALRARCTRSIVANRRAPCRARRLSLSRRDLAPHPDRHRPGEYEIAGLDDPI